MSTTDNENTNEPNPEDQASGEETGEETKPSEEEAQATDGKTEETKLSHDDALSALAKVRKSEAATRTRLRELESKLSEGKSAEEIEALVEEIKNANAVEAHNLVVENVALKFNLPEDLATALKGATREELEAHAKVLQKYAPKAEPSDDPALGGGLNPLDDDESFDPVKAARSARANRW